MRIRALLEREPNHFELAVFSLLWSEHCGYKHSARLLRRLPGSGRRVLQGPGENAGVIDLGDGEAVAFKVESHNHPSAVEPFQGAATGVGGILRDIVAMGARPIALLDGLFFGAPGWRFERAVSGIGHYGNCLAADERVLYRNSSQIRGATIGELVEQRGPGGDAPSWTARPRKSFEVLSIDPVTYKPEWREVARVFKRTASRLLRIKAALGRTLAVTEDHPMVIWENGSLVERPASAIRPGDRLPILTSLPTEDSIATIDLIDSVDDRSIAQFPEGFEVPQSAREVLFRELPRADARHYWRRRNELPVGVFRALEDHLPVQRDELRLRLPGPRSTSVPAVLPVDEDFARLLGYYLAEGCCSPNGSTFKIIWTFGKNARDDAYAGDVQRILDSWRVRYAVEARPSTTAITVSSRLLGRLFIETLKCGSRAHEKQIPSILMSAAPRLQREVIKGIFRSDGSVDYPARSRAVRVRHSTTSRRLHEQLVLLLQSVGIAPATYQRAAKRGVIDGRSVECRAAYQIEFYGSESIAEAAEWFLAADALKMLKRAHPARSSVHAVPRAHRVAPFLMTIAVQDVEPIEGPATVYDLEVPGTHLFATTGGIVTHNCVGVPTVGGTTTFDPGYEDNCLVNAMCVGLLPTERLTRARARGTGNLVVVFGATTGRDGIGGASVLASQELGESSHEKRPSVQIGDPFMGKKLIEASVELVERGLVESLQDCGAAGLASALAEMASGGAGIDVHLDRVPLREELEPWEIIISESQERMVAVLRPRFLEAAAEVFRKWELSWAAIGEVTDSGELRCFFDEDEVAAIPARLLTEEAPRYAVDRAPRAAEPPAWTEARPLAERVSSPAHRSRRPVFEQYDHLVGSRTVRRPGLDAAVLRLRPSLRGLAVALDGPAPGLRDPWLAGATAVLEAARNVACAGGEPLALTDCLNFGNPEKAEIGWELAEAIEGIAQAAEALGIPVVSGNVSLYNETDGRAIPPTPVVGCVGLVPDVRRVPGRWREGDAVLLAAAPSPLDLAAEAALVRFLWKAAPLLSLAHDVDDGDVELALAEAALWSGVGARVELRDEAPRAGSAVLACAPEDVERLGSRGLTRLGVVGGGSVCGVPLTELAEAH